MLLVLKMDPDLDPKHRQFIHNIVVLPSINENTHHKNLIDQIIFLYGRESLDEIRALEKLRIKIKKRDFDLDFLKNCRNRNILPKFAQIEHKNKNKWNKSAFFKLGPSRTRGEIKRIRFNLEHLSKNAFKLHLKLEHTIEPELWKTLDAMTTIKIQI
jgi:hypothetical protein